MARITPGVRVITQNPHAGIHGKAMYRIAATSAHSIPSGTANLISPSMLSKR